MDDEMTSIIKMKTWTFVCLPQGKKAITCRWIYKKKLRINGAVKCYKARLIARGCKQKLEVEFEKTFAPIAKWNTIKVVKGEILLRCTKILSQRHPFLSFLPSLFYHVKTHLWMVMMETRIVII
jgi:hypothetical protein